MATLWLDVTTLLHWRRPAVGVVRVLSECFKYFDAQASEQIRFSRFDKPAGAFFEVPAAEVREALLRHGRGDSTPEPKPARRLADTAERALGYVPGPLREPMRTLARKSEPALRTTLHNVRRAAGQVRNVGGHLSSMLRNPETIESSDLTSATARFREGDVLISCGLDWNEKDLELQYRLKRETGLKQLTFCYDLIPVLLPHLCVGEVAGIYANYYANLAWCSDHVLCISRASERDLHALLARLGAPQPPTSVVRLGSNLPAGGDAGAEPLVKGKYLLFVSTIERRKNHEVLYRAMALLAAQGRTDLPQVVFVGMPGWGVKDFLNDLEFDYRVRGKFVILNHVSDAELTRLYQGALFTVFPSLYEGWGLPLGESLAHGKFCLASNTSSLPEVGGELVEYLDPWETKRWAERIAWYLDHPEEIASREALIREKYVPPKWEDTGRAVYEAARKLAG
ncbi:MAG: glycosyltransferase family 1 protein [Myxococcaceae bacterium]